MAKKMRQAGAVLALAGMVVSTGAQAKTACASASEIHAIQVAAVQQELTDAALTCGPAAIANFNRFIKTFQGELRKSDNVLLAMFKRMHGGAAGTREHDAFKTRAIANAERRRIKPGAHEGFCATAQIVFDAALAPDKPLLEDFVSGVPVYEKNPLDSCAITVAMNLQGVKAGPDIAPTPRPDRPGDVAVDSVVPAVAVPAGPGVQKF